MPSCEGNIYLSLSPAPAYTSSTVTATVGGLSNCQGKTIYIKMYSCRGTDITSCTSSSTGCSASFTAPAQEGTYYFYACIDKNNDGDFDDSGEQTSSALGVKPRCGDKGGSCMSAHFCYEYGGTCLDDKYECPECCCKSSSSKLMAISQISIPIKAGWNLVSFPLLYYDIVDFKYVSPSVYIYNPETSSYNKVNISDASGKGFWVYAYKDTTIEIMGTQSLYPENISLIANKPNLIPVPKGGLRVISQRGNCKITKFYYFNSTDQAWYKWNATNGEYSRFNTDKNIYEVVKIDTDPFIPEGLAIFLYTENDCRLSS